MNRYGGKFNVGDRVRLIEPDRVYYGIVERIQRIVSGPTEYYVRWNGYGTLKYSQDFLEKTFERIEPPTLPDHSDALRYGLCAPSIHSKTHSKKITNPCGEVPLDSHLDNYTYKVSAVTPDSCQHDWKSYKGFSYDYDYCIKCDEKKDA